ncbi:hypothetical protein LTS17_002851 [Exophiala oligosperma]
MRSSIVTLLLVLGNGVLSSGVHHSKPLATVTPCPEAPSRIAPPIITVTSQYQPISTCEERTACFRRLCKTEYSYHTYEYVSTVIPCLDTSTTVTRTEQSVLISRSSSTITNTHVKTKVHHGHTTTTTATARTTVLKEWSAVYKDIGPLAIAGYKGSGLCDTCEGHNGEKKQEVEAIECTHRPRGPTVCEKHAEIWIYQPAPSTTTKAVAICSSRAVASSAGTFTFAFPQREPPATIHVPARTIILTIGGRHPGAVTTTTTTVTETVTTVPGRVWTVFVTRSCLRPTTFTFDVTVTKTITYTVPPWGYLNSCPQRLAGLDHPFHYPNPTEQRDNLNVRAVHIDVVGLIFSRFYYKCPLYHARFHQWPDFREYLYNNNNNDNYYYYYYYKASLHDICFGVLCQFNIIRFAISVHILFNSRLLVNTLHVVFGNCNDNVRKYFHNHFPEFVGVGDFHAELFYDERAEHIECLFDYFQ